MKKILVVDDDQDILDALSLLLQGEGYEVKTCMNGEDVIALSSQEKPDIILLDVLLSGIDGRDVCRALRRKDNIKHVPIIMVSAQPSVGKDAKICGATDFIPKPFDINDLLRKVSEHSR